MSVPSDLLPHSTTTNLVAPSYIEKLPTEILTDILGKVLLFSNPKPVITIHRSNNGHFDLRACDWERSPRRYSITEEVSSILVVSKRFKSNGLRAFLSQHRFDNFRFGFTGPIYDLNVLTEWLHRIGKINCGYIQSLGFCWDMLPKQYDCLPKSYLKNEESLLYSKQKAFFATLAQLQSLQTLEIGAKFDTGGRKSEYIRPITQIHRRKQITALTVSNVAKFLNGTQGTAQIKAVATIQNVYIIASDVEIDNSVARLISDYLLEKDLPEIQVVDSESGETAINEVMKWMGCQRRRNDSDN